MFEEMILILDNEPHIRWTLKALLESEKYSIIAADTIEMALNNFSKHRVSGLITEYWVDQFCTLGAIRGLKERSPETYVMMLTDGEVREKEYEEIINSGVDDFFKKPVSGEKILLHLKKGLKQREILLKKCQLEQELNRMSKRRRIWGRWSARGEPTAVTN